MGIPLFTSNLFRESYCLYPLWNNSCSKNCILVVKKKHTYILVAYSVTHRMRPSKKKAENCLFEFWRALATAVTHAMTHLSSDGAELSDRIFGQNKPFFSTFFIYVCVCLLWLYLYD